MQKNETLILIFFNYRKEPYLTLTLAHTTSLDELQALVIALALIINKSTKLLELKLNLPWSGVEAIIGA